ncbi:hypothetical protein [Thermomonospora umbrina]|nr:hypothetical protein [Thermomonospora umbrina]
MGIKLTDLELDNGHGLFYNVPHAATLAELRDRTKPADHLMLTLQPVVTFAGDTEAEALQRAADWVADSLGGSVILASWFKFKAEEGGDDYYEVGMVLEG